MQEQPIIKSKPWGSIALFPLFGGLFFGAFCVYILRGAIVNGYPQILPIIFGCLFGIIALPCFGSLYFQGGFFAIYEDRLVVYSYIRTKIKTIFIRDIVKWKEEEYDDDKKTKSLTVYTINKKYSITSDDEEYNYEAIKRHLTNTVAPGTSVMHNNEDDKSSQKNSVNRVMLVFYIIVTAFCSSLIYASLRSYFYPEDELKNLSLTAIRGVIVATPESHKRSGRGDYSYVRFDLKDYPKVHFYIESVGYYATSRPYLYQIQAGDSVFLKIPTEDYQKKITKERSLSFADKTDASDIILVYEFSDKRYGYLTFDNYKIANISDSKSGLIGAFVGFIVLILNIRDWYKRNKKNDRQNSV